ncbi:putative sugar O-methyltransferase [Bosea sp. (in: a-proteobacteria)]|uniref:putative sugar O-methyltransferase n=1 Tax=Bosea sp. (in: a-proteobacteria) TaxID=1871050 RepID=UPI003B3A2E87
MLLHMQRCEGVFRPSAFWDHFDEKNLRQLDAEGIENFKRTINQNYFNWLPTTPEDNQFKALLRLMAEQPCPDAFMAVIDKGDAFVESVFSKSPLGSPAAKEIYRLFVGMLWEYTRASLPNGLIDILEEPALGNPIRISLKGRAISQDLANSIRERNTILGPVEAKLSQGIQQNIVEIGAGYGRLAYVILSSAPCRYTIVDIPPALYVSQWYLTRLFPQKKAFTFRPWTEFESVRSAFEDSEIAFLTPDQFYRVPDAAFDIGIAISNLAEMTPAQVEYYLASFDRKVRSFVYIKQWINSENTLDKHVYNREDFDMPSGWRSLVDRIDPVQDKFFETLWERA